MLPRCVFFCLKSRYSSPAQENQDLLIKCISQDLGFSGGKPVAACLIYKCLLHWRSFEVERTSIFDRIIQTISGAIEVTSKMNSVLLNLILFFGKWSGRHCFKFIVNLYAIYWCSKLFPTQGPRQQWQIVLLVIECLDAAVATSAYTESKWGSKLNSTTTQINFKFFARKNVSSKIFILFYFSVWGCSVVECSVARQFILFSYFAYLFISD